LAYGDYVTNFHQDDIMRPAHLELSVGVLEANPAVGFVYSNIQLIDQTGKVIGDHPIPQPEADTVMPGWKIFEMVATTGNSISCPTVVIRKSCYERVGQFDKRLPFAPDLEMWLRLAKYYDVGYLAQPQVACRVHSGQETARFNGTGKDYLDVLRAFNFAFSYDLPPIYGVYAGRAYQTLARQAIHMTRWQLRQGKVTSGLRYAFVMIAAWLQMYIRSCAYI
jgi:hypothetical protein